MKQYKLLNPGPACTTDNVKQAMLNVGDVCPREIETGDLMKKVSNDIKELLTSNPDQYECTLLTSSGTGSVEMVISSLPKDAKVLNTNQNKTTIIKPSRSFRSVLACIAGSHSNSPETKIRINA